MKKIWKRIAALLMCLALMAPAAGLAAEGDAVLARRNGMDGFTDYISHGFVLGDQLVLLGSESVYTWRHGEADLTAIPWDLTATTAMYGSIMEEEEDGERAYTNYQTLAVYTDGEEIYLVVGTSTMLESDGFSTFDGAQLWTLDISGEKAAAAPVEDSEIDWEELVDYYGDESYPRSLEGCVWLDGVLYGVTYGSNDMEAYAIPTDGGYCEILEDVPTPRSVSLYKDGKVLFSSFDYNNPEQFRFVAWDPEEEELEEVCAIEIERYVTPSSIVYDEQTDRIYYTMQGLLIALDPETGAREEVNDVPSSFSGNDSAMILPGGYYAAVGYEAVIVRNTDPTKRAQQRLSVANIGYIDAVNSAYYDFANMRGDVSVAISTDYLEPSAIIEGMMNRSEDYDIFVLDMQNEAFGALYERGYMAELKGSEQIDELFKQLYPDVAERLSTDGVPVAVPLYCYGSTFGVNTEALEKAGLTMDDIPTNWCDLLDSLEELHAKLEDTGVALFYDFYTIRDIRSLLFGVIFEDYIAYMESVDPTMGFNTEVFNEVLAKLDAIDFAAMGYKEEINYEEEFNWGSETMLLFEPYIGCTMGDFYGTYEPVLLSLTPEIEPALKLTVSAAFINPYSKNYDIALEFLECAMGNVQEYVLASLCDIEVEPLRDRYYAENLQSAQESVAQLTQMLAEAEEAEKQAIEESLMYAEQWLVDIEENNWEISPKAIEWYRANDDKIHIAQFNVLYSAETQNTAEISEYIMQYTEQEISAEEMLKGIDSKLQMMILEGN